MIAPVSFCEDVIQAGSARRYVGRDKLVFARLGYAVPDLKVLLSGRIAEIDGYRFDMRERRGFMIKISNKCIEYITAALDLDFNVFGCIADPAFELILPGQAVHEGAEAYTLHDSARTDAGKKHWIVRHNIE